MATKMIEMQDDMATKAVLYGYERMKMNECNECTCQPTADTKDDEIRCMSVKYERGKEELIKDGVVNS